jgi:hypothetical protein
MGRPVAGNAPGQAATVAADVSRRTKPQERAARSGRFVPGPESYEPPAPLLELLRGAASRAVRSVFNDPRTTAHVERSVLAWLLEWNGEGNIISIIALRAANEARKILALDEPARRPVLGRSHDLPKIYTRVRNAKNISNEERPESSDEGR